MGVENGSGKAGTGLWWLLVGLIVINAFWGASGVAIKEAYLQLGTVEILALRFAIATPLLIAATLLWKGRKAFAVELKDIPYFAALATIGVTLSFYLQVLSLDYTTATNFTLIFNLSTFFIIFLSAWLMGEKLTGNKIIGALVAFAGLALIVTNGNFSLSPNFLGDGIALLGTLAWAVYTVLGKRANEKYSALTVLNYVFIFGTLELIPMYLLSPHIPITEFTVLTWLSMGFLSICCSLIAFLVYNYGLEKLPASTIAVFIYVMPLSGVLLAAIVLGEALTVYTLAGAALIIFGMIFAEKRATAKLEPDKQ
ncbi:DMT family transporter [Methanocella sp. MCL-LM]|uniref:DMT family transporter n=1 Tax=Methanocella sp. MCL-LM TaxID=3412035 RepID=UPI003C72E85B